jgi:hypothetical protein
MALENEVSELRNSINLLTSAINKLINSAPVSGTSTAAAAAKEPAAKPEAVKEEPAKKAAPAKAKTAESEQLDAMKEVIEEAGEPEFPELPAGTRDEAYCKKHVTPVFLQLVAAADKDTAVALIKSFKKSDGTSAANTLEIPTKEWDKAVDMAKKAIEKAKSAEVI